MSIFQKLSYLPPLRLQYFPNNTNPTPISAPTPTPNPIPTDNETKNAHLKSSAKLNQRFIRSCIFKRPFELPRREKPNRTMPLPILNTPARTNARSDIKNSVHVECHRSRWLTVERETSSK